MATPSSDSRGAFFRCSLLAAFSAGVQVAGFLFAAFGMRFAILWPSSLLVSCLASGRTARRTELRPAGSIVTSGVRGAGFHHHHHCRCHRRPHDNRRHRRAAESTSAAALGLRTASLTFSARPSTFAPFNAAIAWSACAESSFPQTQIHANGPCPDPSQRSRVPHCHTARITTGRTIPSREIQIAYKNVLHSFLFSVFQSCGLKPRQVGTGQVVAGLSKGIPNIP